MRKEKTTTKFYYHKEVRLAISCYVRNNHKKIYGFVEVKSFMKGPIMITRYCLN